MTMKNPLSELEGSIKKTGQLPTIKELSKPSQRQGIPAVKRTNTSPRAGLPRRAGVNKTAFGPTGGGGFSSTIFTPQNIDIVYNNIIEYYLPKDYPSQHRLWRSIYLFDPVCGPCIDLYSDLPWSEFSVVGLKDPKQVQLLEDAIAPLKFDTYLPWATREFLSLGKMCSHFLFDRRSGGWSGQIIHNPDYIKIHPVPMMEEDALIDLLPNKELIAFANSKDKRNKEFQRKLNPSLLESIKRGKPIPLDVSNTLYLPRKAAPYDYHGSSIYTRILGTVIFERALMNASIVGAQRRAGPIRMVSYSDSQSGEDGFMPLDDDISVIADLLIQAEEDPVGSVIGTKRKVDVNSLDTAQVMWKVSDESGFINEMKLKGLGLSDSFLSGDMNYSTTDAQLSVFLERVKVLRKYIKQKYILEKAIHPIMEIHDLGNRKQADMPGKNSHMVKTSNSVDMGTVDIQFKKQLTPIADREWLDILDSAADKGIPITLQTWASAAGVDLESEIENLPRDIELRNKIRELTKDIEGDEEEDGFGFNSSILPKISMGAGRRAKVKPLGLDQHPFYSVANKRFLDVNGQDLMDCINYYADRSQDAMPIRERWKKLKYWAKTKLNLSPMQIETVKYAMAQIPLKVPKLKRKTAAYLNEELDRRLDKEQKVYWAVMSSISNITEQQETRASKVNKRVQGYNKKAMGDSSKFFEQNNHLNPDALLKQKPATVNLLSGVTGPK